MKNVPNLSTMYRPWQNQIKSQLALEPLGEHGNNSFAVHLEIPATDFQLVGGQHSQGHAYQRIPQRGVFLKAVFHEAVFFLGGKCEEFLLVAGCIRQEKSQVQVMLKFKHRA